MVRCSKFPVLYVRLNLQLIIALSLPTSERERDRATMLRLASAHRRKGSLDHTVNGSRNKFHGMKADDNIYAEMHPPPRNLGWKGRACRAAMSQG